MTKQDMIKTIKEEEKRLFESLMGYEYLCNNAKKNDQEKVAYWEQAVDEERHAWVIVKILMKKLNIE